RARREPPSRDVLRAGREGAPSSRCGPGDSRGRPHARGAWRSSRPVACLPHAVEGARRAPPGGAGGRGCDGHPPRFFRPPLGHTSVTTTLGARRAGMTIVGWAPRGLDGMRGQTPEAVVARLARSVTDGAIVMLHDAAEHDDFEPASVRALPELLRLLDDR